MIEIEMAATRPGMGGQRGSYENPTKNVGHKTFDLLTILD